MRYMGYAAIKECSNCGKNFELERDSVDYIEHSLTCQICLIEREIRWKSEHTPKKQRAWLERNRQKLKDYWLLEVDKQQELKTEFYKVFGIGIKSILTEREVNVRLL